MTEGSQVSFAHAWEEAEGEHPLDTVLFSLQAVALARRSVRTQPFCRSVCDKVVAIHRILHPATAFLLRSSI